MEGVQNIGKNCVCCPLSLLIVSLAPSIFTKIRACTTLVHFSYPGAKNPSLDGFWEVFSLGAVKLGYCSPFDNCLWIVNWKQPKSKRWNTNHTVCFHLDRPCLLVEILCWTFSHKFRRSICWIMSRQRFMHSCVGHFPINFCINLLCFVLIGF